MRPRNMAKQSRKLFRLILGELGTGTQDDLELLMGIELLESLHNPRFGSHNHEQRLLGERCLGWEWEREGRRRYDGVVKSREGELCGVEMDR